MYPFRFLSLRALRTILLAALFFLPRLALAQVMVFSPHPDDDLITSSGVIYRALQHGQTVTVVYMTNGDLYGGSTQGYQRQDEAVAGEACLGLAENNLVFLGYPDGGLQTIYQSYTDPASVFLSPNNISATYGDRGLGRKDYHSYRFSAPASYNLPNILQDLGDLLTQRQPQQIFVTSEFDHHTDHSTTYLMVKAALAALHASLPAYAPVIHKTIVHWEHISNPDWPNAMDPTACVLEPPDLESSTSLDWSARESLDVPLAMQSTDVSANPKYQAINAHASQGGAGSFLSQFIHKDEIFWPEAAFGASKPPLVDAGPDQTVLNGQGVHLDGTGSLDPNGGALGYQWTQTGGTSVSLHNPGTATPSFTAPASHPVGDVLTFELVVSNGSYTSVPDSVSVIPKTAQSISFSNPGDQGFGSTLALGASATSGLDVTYTTSTPSVVSLDGGQARFVGTGGCSITASQAGDATYAAAAPVTRTFQVDPVAPGAPVMGSATAGVNQATVSFGAPLSDGGDAITSYTVTSSPGNHSASGTASPITVSGLSNDTAYSFTVRATNGAGTGSASAASNSVTPRAVAPDAPTQVAAVAGNGRAVVAFLAPAFDGGAAITGYTVTVNGGPLQVTGAGSPITLTGLANHAACTFTVSATNSVGTGPASAASNTVIPSPGGTALVVYDAGLGSEEADLVAHLGQLGAAGNNLTVTTATSLPGTLGTFAQVWDVRYGDSTPLGSADQEAYLAYLAAGGQVALVGGSACGGAREASILQLIAAAGGGTATLAAPSGLQQVQAPFTGPVSLAAVPFTGAAGAVDLGAGAAVAADGSTPSVASVVAWAPGRLGLAPAGGLIALFSADALQTAADPACQALAANLVSYQTRIATASPRITGVDVPPAGSYRAGARLAFTVHYSAPVTVSGTPALPLALGPGTGAAAYAGGSGSTELSFSYLVQAGDAGPVAPGPALLLTGSGSGSLADADGFPARVALAGVGDCSALSVDTLAPATPAITGISGLDIRGTAEPGSQVDLYLGSQLLAEVTADSQGDWTWSAATGLTGALTAIAVDPAGNASGASGPADLDTVVPVANPVRATVAADSPGATIPLQITQATATRVSVADPAEHGTATAQGTAITYTPDPGYVGTDRFTYTAANANGTSSAAVATVLVASPAAPALDLAMIADGSATCDILLGVSGVVSTPNGLQSLTLDGVQVPVQAGGRFSCPVRLAEGANGVTLEATDAAGLATTVTRSVTLDLAAPILSIGQPSDGALVTGADLVATGTVDLAPGTEGTDTLASVGCSVNGGPAQAATLAGRSFSLVLGLAAGTNTLEFIATTASGRSSHILRTVTLGADLQGAVTDPGADLLLTASTYVIRGTAGSTSLPVSVTVSAGGQVYSPDVVDGAFQQAITLDSNQTLQVLVTLTDAQNRSMTLVRNLVRASTTAPGLFTLADAQRALEIANGLTVPTAEDLARYDLAPRTGGTQAPDGAISLEDAALVLWLASGNSL